MKKINSTYKINPILFSLLFTVILGCDSILDINKDPFAAGDDQVAEQPGLLMTITAQIL